MEIKFVIPRNDDQIFESHLYNSLKKIGCQAIQIANDSSIKSITHKYNLAVNILRNATISEDELVVFSHEDVSIIDAQFFDKITYLFNSRPDVGIVGIVGSEKISMDGWWLDTRNNPKGRILQRNIKRNIKRGMGTLIEFSNVGFYDNVVSVDNCFFVVRGTLLNRINFDITNMINDNHFYCNDLCFQSLLNKYKVVVADILIYHHSTEHFEISNEWTESQKIFVEKYKDMKFPITINSFDLNTPEIIEVKL
ncbi:MAG: glycosyltransferase [Candidatus Pacearchaeota archaeon]